MCHTLGSVESNESVTELLQKQSATTFLRPFLCLTSKKYSWSLTAHCSSLEFKILQTLAIARLQELCQHEIGGHVSKAKTYGGPNHVLKAHLQSGNILLQQEGMLCLQRQADAQDLSQGPVGKAQLLQLLWTNLCRVEKVDSSLEVSR